MPVTLVTGSTTCFTSLGISATYPVQSGCAMRISLLRHRICRNTAILSPIHQKSQIARLLALGGQQRRNRQNSPKEARKRLRRAVDLESPNAPFLRSPASSHVVLKLMTKPRSAFESGSEVRTVAMHIWLSLQRHGTRSRVEGNNQLPRRSR